MFVNDFALGCDVIESQISIMSIMAEYDEGVIVCHSYRFGYLWNEQLGGFCLEFHVL